jgi:hypothetical protein
MDSQFALGDLIVLKTDKIIPRKFTSEWFCGFKIFSFTAGAIGVHRLVLRPQDQLHLSDEFKYFDHFVGSERQLVELSLLRACTAELADEPLDVLRVTSFCSFAVGAREFQGPCQLDVKELRTLLAESSLAATLVTVPALPASSQPRRRQRKGQSNRLAQASAARKNVPLLSHDWSKFKAVPSDISQAAGADPVLPVQSGGEVKLENDGEGDGKAAPQILAIDIDSPVPGDSLAAQPSQDAPPKEQKQDLSAKAVSTVPKRRGRKPSVANASLVGCQVITNFFTKKTTSAKPVDLSLQ